MAIDLRTLQDELVRADEWEKVGGLSYLSGLELDLPELSGLERYVDILLDRWQRREVIRLATEAAASATNGHRPGDIIAGLYRDLILMEAGSAAMGYVQAAAGWEDLKLDRAPGESVGIQTGIEDLDAQILGLEPGLLYLVGGSTGHGKTALALTILLSIARRQVPCAMVSLEMMESQITGRLLAQLSGIPHRSIRMAELTSGQRQRLEDAHRELARLPLWVDFSPTQTPEMISARARRIKMEHDIQVLAIDYLGLVSGGSEGQESEALRLGAISRRCKLLAKELKVAILVLHQLNRQPDHRTDHRPQLSDLKGSGSLEQDADKVLFPFRPSLFDDMAPPGEAEILIRKNRDGPPTALRLGWHGSVMRFVGAERHQEDQRW